MASVGCSYFARFSPPVAQDVNVILKENDFQVTETNLVGEAGVFYLFGIIPTGDERLFSRALADLYGPIESRLNGTSSQLLNWTCDETRTNYIIGSYYEVTFRADLMVFDK